MAIRINQGAAPQAGRMSMPKGTYLPNNLPFSNPSTAADGALGGGSGLNPGSVVPSAGMIAGGNLQPGGTPSPLQQYNQPNFIGNFLQQMDTDMRNQPTMVDMANQFDIKKAEAAYGTLVANGMKGFADIIKGLSNPSTAPTSSFTPPSNQTNSLVGTEVSASPNFLTNHQVQQIMPGLTDKDKQRIMQEKGYTQSYQAGVGVVWVKTGEGSGGQQNTSSAVSGELDARGRPQFVDPTQLEPGERVTAASGVTYAGGTPYTNAAGTTVAQYAITLPGGANDTKGRYKWKSTVRQDQDGNWVRIYRKELRKVYTRSHRKKVYARREEAQSQARDVSDAEISQLVNLRADFG